MKGGVFMSLVRNPLGLYSKPIKDFETNSKPKNGDFITDMERAKINVNIDPNTYSDMIWKSYALMHGS